MREIKQNKAEYAWNEALQRAARASTFTVNENAVLPGWIPDKYPVTYTYDQDVLDEDGEAIGSEVLTKTKEKSLTNKAPFFNHEQAYFINHIEKSSADANDGASFDTFDEIDVL